MESNMIESGIEWGPPMLVPTDQEVLSWLGILQALPFPTEALEVE